MSIIQFDHLTKDYGNNKGVFDVSFEVNKGEVFGYLGLNGAGKTTSIRHLLGFLKPDSGRVLIEDKEVFKNHYLTNKDIGYLPGEISFPEKMTGLQVLKWNRELKKIKDSTKEQELIEYFELKNLNMKVQRMSKGMKQKIGIICAFVADPEILVLDEPTSGLDPLMQAKFINYIQQEKKKGKTILMSTHIFQEVERTCDRVAIIKNGRIVKLLDVKKVLHSESQNYEVVLNEKREISSTEYLKVTKIDEYKYSLSFSKKDINAVLKYLTQYDIKDMEEIKNTIEDSFMKLYSNEEDK